MEEASQREPKGKTTRRVGIETGRCRMKHLTRMRQESGKKGNRRGRSVKVCVYVGEEEETEREEENEVTRAYISKHV